MEYATERDAYKAERRTITSAFGANLRAARKAARHSQDSLARVAYIHRSEISFLERGKRGPGLTMLLILADALSVEPAVLLRGLPVPQERRPSPYTKRRPGAATAGRGEAR
jgi:transcriptional regulator with XRE-family HTH domain